jgi:hypothetical protein
VTTILVIVLVVAALLVLVLFAGGLIAAARIRDSRDDELLRRLEEADRALAAARAQDRGWDPAGLQSAARAAHARRGGAPPRDLQLVQVVDRPGTEHDQARFRVVDTDEREHDVLLGRQGDEWVEISGA